MAKYYILIKKRGSARWLGAIPARSGVSLSSLKKSIKRGLKTYNYKIVTSAQLKRILGRIRPIGRARRTTRRKTRKIRRTKAKKRRSKRKTHRTKRRRSKRRSKRRK